MRARFNFPLLFYSLDTVLGALFSTVLHPSIDRELIKMDCRWCLCEPCDRYRFGARLVADRVSLRRLQPEACGAAIDKALYHIYYCLKHGRFERKPRYFFPRCVHLFLLDIDEDIGDAEEPTSRTSADISPPCLPPTVGKPLRSSAPHVSVPKRRSKRGR